MQSKSETKYEFDSGLHYVGNITDLKQQIAMAVLPGRNPEWQQQGFDTKDWFYDALHFPGKDVHKYPIGLENVKSDLK